MGGPEKCHKRCQVNFFFAGDATVSAVEKAELGKLKKVMLYT